MGQGSSIWRIVPPLIGVWGKKPVPTPEQKSGAKETVVQYDGWVLVDNSHFGDVVAYALFQPHENPEPIEAALDALGTTYNYDQDKRLLTIELVEGDGRNEALYAIEASKHRPIIKKPEAQVFFASLDAGHP